MKAKNSLEEVDLQTFDCSTGSRKLDECTFFLLQVSCVEALAMRNKAYVSYNLLQL